MIFDRINIEISNICNLKCTFCPEVERSKQVMASAEFAAVIAKVKHRTKEVVLHLLGEPLGHPEFDSIVSIAAVEKVPVNIVTNGVLLSESRSLSLLNPIVRQVSFSLQSFLDNFGNQDPKTYLSKISSFIERALVERPDMFLNLRFWDIKDGTRLNEASSGIRDSELGKQISEKFGFSWDTVAVDLKYRKSLRLRGRLYLHFDSRFEWPSVSAPPINDHGTCKALSGHIGILADGTVVPCCLDHKGNIALGSIHNSSLEQILESERAVEMLRGFQRGILTEQLCKTCGFISRFSKQSERKRART